MSVSFILFCKGICMPKLLCTTNSCYKLNKLLVQLVLWTLVMSTMYFKNINRLLLSVLLA